MVYLIAITIILHITILLHWLKYTKSQHYRPKVHNNTDDIIYLFILFVEVK